MRNLLFVIIFLSLIACMQPKSAQHFAFRLKPGQDLYQSIDSIVKANQINAGWIVTCVGSLTNYHIRFANQPNGVEGQGHFEIVSLVGTLSNTGSHIHISISDSLGNTIGGHLLEGCKIYTTAEMVIASTNEFTFSRAEDGSTPWKELQINTKK